MSINFFQYCPPIEYVWYVYWGSVTLVLMIIKLLNYALHHMYDTTECIQEEVKDWNETKRYLETFVVY